MARKKVSPEAQIIALFTGLSEESKRMVMFGLNAIQSNEVPKSASASALPAARRSSRSGASSRGDGLSQATSATGTEGASSVVRGAGGD